MMEIRSSPCTWQPRRRGRRHANNTIDETNNGSSPSSQPQEMNVDLPEDAWRHIYSLMSMRDAARAACVSHRFLRFWRCYPNLTFNQETLAANRQTTLEWYEDTGKYVFRKTRQVLEKHSGVGVKKLRLNLSVCDIVDTSVLDSWLRAFVKPGVTELTVILPECYAQEYGFPYSILSHGEAATSVQSLYLVSCGFHPTSSSEGRLLGCSRSLSRVCLRKVSITGEELGLFLSSCFALERLDLSNCDLITSIMIPRVQHKLSIVRVQMCRTMQTIESESPRLSTFHYEGRSPLLRFSLGHSLETKELDLHATRMVGMIQYAGSHLPSIAPNLETLVLSTVDEKLKAPVIIHKFQKLKHLVICLGESGGFAKGYDFVSLACFLDACPSLETFILRIEDGFAWYKKYVIFGEPEDDSSQPRQEIPELRHGGLGNLRKATITGFCSAKSLIELTCHILTAAPSLQRLMLDTSPGYDRKRFSADRCSPMHVVALWDAERALAAVKTYVVPKVPAGVELKVLGPCSRCHAMDAKAMEGAESRIPQSYLKRQADGSIVMVIVHPRN